MPNTLTVIDNRTGLRYEIPVYRGAIRAMDLRTIRTTPDDFSGVRPCLHEHGVLSKRHHVHRRQAFLRYRGYGIEYLAEKCSFLEVAYLLLSGELPTAAELSDWVQTITHHTMIHETAKKFLEGFRYDAHPMACLSAPWRRSPRFIQRPATCVTRPHASWRFARLIGKVPTIAAYTYRHSLGYPYVYPYVYPTIN